MKIRFSIIVILLSFTLYRPAFSQIPGVEPKSPFSFGGYVKYLTTYAIPKSGSNSWDHLVHQRFNFEYRYSDELSFAAGMRNRLLWGDSFDLPSYDEFVTADHGHWDLSFNWLKEDDIIGNTTFDRLYFDWQPSNWQIRGGRQRINWGMATLWNPNDLFNVYSMFDFDYEEHPGTDAILVNHTLGWASSAEAVWGLGKDWDDTSLACRYRFNKSGYDLQILGGKQDIDLVIGAGFSGSIKGAGLNGEISYFYPTRDRSEGFIQNETAIATLETDYSLSGRRNVTLKASVLYISNPEDQGNALIYLNQPLTAKTISFARWTGYGDIAFDITSLSRQTLGASLYDDGSLYFIVSNAYSLADDWQLLLVWQHFDGSTESLFGKNPTDMIYGRIRWSF